MSDLFPVSIGFAAAASVLAMLFVALGFIGFLGMAVWCGLYSLLVALEGIAR